MPELPDLAAFKAYVDGSSLQQAIAEVTVPDARILADLSAQQLGQQLKGRRFRDSRRHGKFLFLHADDHGWLILHFGMTGRPLYGRQEDELPEQAKAVFRFQDGGRLCYLCTRMLGRVAFTTDLAAYLEAQELGPDALADDLDASSFAARLAGRRAAIKAILMDQSVVAGIGNNCADEICFQARLHPKTSVDDLDKAGIGSLFDTMRQVLETMVRCKLEDRDWPQDYLLHAREQAGKCPACNGDLERLDVNGRSGWFCPACQHKA